MFLISFIPLLINLIELITNRNNVFIKFLLERYLYSIKFKKYKYINNIKYMKRDYKHYIITENNVGSENVFLEKLFKE